MGGVQIFYFTPPQTKTTWHGPVYILAIIKRNCFIEVYCAFVLFYDIEYLDSLVIS
jgi:hypothetical protein